MVRLEAVDGRRLGNVISLGSLTAERWRIAARSTVHCSIFSRRLSVRSSSSSRSSDYPEVRLYRCCHRLRYALLYMYQIQKLCLFSSQAMTIAVQCVLRLTWNLQKTKSQSDAWIETRHHSCLQRKRDLNKATSRDIAS
jgi:hypothetical protein